MDNKVYIVIMTEHNMEDTAIIGVFLDKKFAEQVLFDEEFKKVGKQSKWAGGEIVELEMNKKYEQE